MADASRSSHVPLANCVINTFSWSIAPGAGTVLPNMVCTLSIIPAAIRISRMACGVSVITTTMTTTGTGTNRSAGPS
jgi:hypothetical protein